MVSVRKKKSSLSMRRKEGVEEAQVVLFVVAPPRKIEQRSSKPPWAMRNNAGTERQRREDHVKTKNQLSGHNGKSQDEKKRCKRDGNSMEQRHRGEKLTTRRGK